DGLYMVAAKYFQEYCRAVDNQEPEATLAHAKLAEALLLGGQHAAALKEADGWLARPSTPRSGLEADMLQLQRCGALMAAGNGASCLEKLKELAMRPVDSPVRFPAVQLLGEYWGRSGAWTELTALLEGRLGDYKSGDSRRIRIHLQLAKAYLGAGRGEDALRTLEAVGGEQPAGEGEALEIRQLRMQILSGMDVNKAMAVYEGVKNAIPEEESVRWYTALVPLARACFEKGMYEAAANIAVKVQRVADTVEGRINAALMAVESLVKLSHVVEARDLLAALLEREKSASEDGSIVMRLAELKLMNRERRSAAELFASVADNAKADRNLRYRAAVQAAENLGKEGESAASIRYYRLAATLSDSTEATVEAMKLAAGKSAEAGKNGDAVALYQEIALKYGGKAAGAAECLLEAGRLLDKMGEPAKALKEYNSYIAAYPNGSAIWTARLAAARSSMILAGKDAAALAKLGGVLVELAGKCPDEELATQAYFEAVRIADMTGNSQEAMNILDAFCRRYPDSGKSRVAMHRGILLRFQLNDSAQAYALGGEFLKRFPKDAAAAEIAMLMGDHKVAEGDLEAAREFYAVAEKAPASLPLVQLARLEWARCAMKLKDNRNAAAKVEEILKAAGSGEELLARAEMLGGDIAASVNDTEGARKYFAAARNRAGDTILGYAALARQAEMLMSESSGNAGKLMEAEKCLAAVLKAPELPWELWARACFLQGRCAELAGNVDRAIVIYQTLFGKYDADIRGGIRRSQANFCNVGWALAQLLERRRPQNGHKDPEDFRQARRIYSILAESGLPRAGEAEKRADYLRKTHKLGTR
ncbi:MAG: tetratricopeptide repeat protein, partial [Victivallales bacterium]|nr:tetratricopeptide repeat protein [Victivallales bacterium]